MGEEFVTLTHETLSKCLGNVEKTVDGGGYAFTKLDASGRDLTDLGNKVEQYEHLRHVVVSNNKIVDLTPVSKLPHVISLTASTNAVANLDCMKEAVLPWCQILDISVNQLMALSPLLSLERLRVLDLHGNQIASLEAFGGHPEIEYMRLEQNKLTNLEGFGSMPKLKKLNLSENELISLGGLDAPILEDLDLSKNQLALMDGIAGAPAVKTLNASSNKLEGDEEMLELKKLSNAFLPQLQHLLVDGNPMCETFGEGVKLEVLISVPTISIVDGVEVTDEERVEAGNMMKGREQERAAAAAREAEEGEGED